MNTTTLPPAQADETMEMLYSRYHDFVYRVCLRYTKNKDEAEDMTQEVFIKVLSAWKGFAGAAQPSTWLYRIAANHCLDLLRWKKRQESLVESYAVEMLSEEREEENPGRPRIADLLEFLEDGMDDMDRPIVFLRYTVGLTQKEIGGLCDVSRVAITKRLKKFESRATGLRERFDGSSKLAA